jgi:hypothetical protein
MWPDRPQVTSKAEVTMRLFLGVLVAGCGGSTGTSEATFLEDYARESCDWMARCNDDFSSDYASRSACVDEVLAEGDSLPSTCAFEQETAEACISGIRAAACDDDFFEGPVCYSVCGGDTGDTAGR